MIKSNKFKELQDVPEKKVSEARFTMFLPSVWTGYCQSVGHTVSGKVAVSSNSPSGSVWDGAWSCQYQGGEFDPQLANIWIRFTESVSTWVCVSGNIVGADYSIGIIGAAGSTASQRKDAADPERRCACSGCCATFDIVGNGIFGNFSQRNG